MHEGLQNILTSITMLKKKIGKRERTSSFFCVYCRKYKFQRAKKKSLVLTISNLLSILRNPAYYLGWHRQTSALSECQGSSRVWRIVCPTSSGIPAKQFRKLTLPLASLTQLWQALNREKRKPTENFWPK